MDFNDFANWASILSFIFGVICGVGGNKIWIMFSHNTKIDINK